MIFLLKYYHLSIIENDESNINWKVELKNVHQKLKRVIHFGTFFNSKWVTYCGTEGVVSMSLLSI